MGADFDGNRLLILQKKASQQWVPNDSKTNIFEASEKDFYDLLSGGNLWDLVEIL